MPQATAPQPPNLAAQSTTPPTPSTIDSQIPPICSPGDIRFTHFVENTYKSSVFFTALTNSATPTYDANGNTKTMSGATFEYDQKNQLKSVSGLDSNSLLVTVTHSYDSMGRRISSTKNTQTTMLMKLCRSELHCCAARHCAPVQNAYRPSAFFAYDGWNVVEEYNSATPSTPTKIHTWGIDLSGSAQGAGGVGGLLFTEDLVANTTWHHHYDGNGNVTHLTNAAAQGVGMLMNMPHMASSPFGHVAFAPVQNTYKPSVFFTYDAFGNTVTATAINKYRFSTKPIDEEITSTPLYYYGYRFYTPLTGRWINRDPIEESGGLNLYGFVGNESISYSDVLGLDFEFTYQFIGDFKTGFTIGASTYSRIATVPGDFPGSENIDIWGWEEKIIDMNFIVLSLGNINFKDKKVLTSNTMQDLLAGDNIGGSDSFMAIGTGFTWTSKVTKADTSPAANVVWDDYTFLGVTYRCVSFKHTASVEIQTTVSFNYEYSWIITGVAGIGVKGEHERIGAANAIAKGNVRACALCAGEDKWIALKPEGAKLIQ